MFYILNTNFELYNKFSGQLKNVELMFKGVIDPPICMRFYTL